MINSIIYSENEKEYMIMGWAKYYEDNNELIDERLSLSKSLHIDISIVCSPVVTLPRKDGDVKTDQSRTETFSDKTIICITLHKSVKNGQLKKAASYGRIKVLP